MKTKTKKAAKPAAKTQAKAKAAPAKPAEPGKASVAGIVDAMLLEGKHQRAAIVDAVRAARPDYKDPSAIISMRFRKLVQDGKNPGLVGGQARRSPGAALAEAGREAAAERRYQRGVAALDRFVAEDDARCAAFAAARKRLDEQYAKEPRLKRVWA
jgi:hypothetical protein